MMLTPTQSRHKRAQSPPISVAASSQFTTTPQPKLNVVTRLALEGKAKQGDDGATIRMYLKLSIPIDSVSPGSTIPLLPEENLKLLSAQVHPLDIHSAPYNFSSTTFPLLNNAARALHLPSLSQKSYLAVFGVPTPASPTVHSSRTSSSTIPSPNTPPLDEKYTGHIIVSGYNISYILPREFPPRFNAGDSALRVSTFSATQMRRPSVSERNNMHFMAAIELWIPYASRPSKAPFLISIPVPRCLSNSIKLRIYPPTTTSTSSSMASLSSADEDPGAWELASEPHVTRTTSRSGSSADMADDESSDSSAYTDGPSGGILVQGTFPSTERLRVRWAQPTKNIANTDGRRRVGVNEAAGEMTAAVLGKAQDPSSGREGILMRLEYKGTCKGIWFPGVATMLGMDIGLEVKGADVVWLPGEDAKWTVTGGTGYTGFDVGPPSTPISRQPSLEFPNSMSTSSMLYAPSITTRQDSSSTSSLLRAPLPNDRLPEYSFESSPTSSTPSVTLSSVSSLPPMSEGRSRASSDAVASCRSPAVPITIHINMNDIVPPSKNVFTFSITGTVLILSRHHPRIMNPHGSDSDSDINPVVLPRFCVLAADSETVSTIIRNESEGCTVEVYYISGDLRDAQTRKTVLQRNGINRCNNDGARIALRPTSRTAILQRGEQVADDSRLSPRHSPLSGNKAALSPLALAPIHGGLMRRKRDGPLMISSVDVIVTPLFLNGASYPDAHAVRIHTHAPSDTDTDWLEFGLTQAASLSSDGKGREYQVDIVSVSMDNVPVRFESSAFAERDERPMIDLVPSYDEKTRKHWITWVKVHGDDQGGLVTVDYVVSKIGNSKDSKHAKSKTNFDILIPTFALPVGRLEVTVETYLEMATLRSNFAHQQKSREGYRLLHYSLDRFFTPTLSLDVERYSSRFRMRWLSLGKIFLSFLWIFPAFLVLRLLLNLGTELEHVRQSLDRFDVVHSFDHGKSPAPSVETIFITTTILLPPSSVATEASSMDGQTTIASFTSRVPIITTASTDPTPSASSLRASDRSQIDTTIFTSTPTPSPSPRLSENALISIPAFPFEWSNIRINIPPSARKTVDRVLEGLGIVWQIFRKAYHYPLDPP
ncbi:hypothetical protein J3R82DRAFT_5838 [Butyriboletus roseoflavus]|nr:hypothetical protein J3R82DRAFT_5838 [Butyriboletus roseoflavus]